MGYSGYTEYLCENGHYFTRDCWDSKPSVCPYCQSFIKYFHSVDTTNGYDEEYPDTCRAEKNEIGFDDTWHDDHYGNRYATKRLRYKPLEISDEKWKLRLN